MGGGGEEKYQVCLMESTDGLQADHLPFGKILKVLGYLRKIRYHLELFFENALLASILSSNLLLVLYR